MRLIHAVRDLNAATRETGGHQIEVIALHTEGEKRAMFVREADVAYDPDPRPTARISTTPSSSAPSRRPAPMPPGSAGVRRRGRRLRRSLRPDRGGVHRSER